MQTVLISRAKSNAKKFRVDFKDGSHVEFGGRGYSDYTIHGDAKRMRQYVRRHGGVFTNPIHEEDDVQIQHGMLQVQESSKETWGAEGIRTAGFWSRWLLWSHPTLEGATRFIQSRFHLRLQFQLD